MIFVGIVAAFILGLGGLPAIGRLGRLFPALKSRFGLSSKGGGTKSQAVPLAATPPVPPAPRVDRRQALVDAMQWQDARRCAHIWRPSSAGYFCGFCGVSQELWDAVQRSSAAERMAEAHRYPAGPLRGARRQSRRGWSPGPP
jgi:hypothetical protein